MKKKFLLLIIFTIFVISSISLFLVLNYIDPYNSPSLAVWFLVITFVLGLSSFLSMIFYFIKKIYYRWDVFIYNIKSSFRQWFFVSLFIVWTIVFYILNVSLFIPIILLFILFLFLELFISSIVS